MTKVSGEFNNSNLVSKKNNKIKTKVKKQMSALSNATTENAKNAAIVNLKLSFDNYSKINKDASVDSGKNKNAANKAKSNVDSSKKTNGKGTTKATKQANKLKNGKSTIKRSGVTYTVNSKPTSTNNEVKFDIKSGKKTGTMSIKYGDDGKTRIETIEIGKGKNKKTITSTYDNKGICREKVINTNTATITREYDATKKINKKHVENKAKNTTRDYYYDDNGQRAKLVVKDNNNNTKTTYDYEYDNNGKLVGKFIQKTKDGVNVATKGVLYDSKGRKISSDKTVTNSDGSTTNTHFEYKKNKLSSKVTTNIDATGNTVSESSSEYNIKTGKIKREICKDNINKTKTEKFYNEQGNIQTDIVTDLYEEKKLYKLTDYTYDESGEKAQTSICYDFINNLIETYTYDNNGENPKLTNKTDVTEDTIESLHNAEKITDAQYKYLLDQIKTGQAEDKGEDVGNNYEIIKKQLIELEIIVDNKIDYDKFEELKQKLSEEQIKYINDNPEGLGKLEKNLSNDEGGSNDALSQLKELDIMTADGEIDIAILLSQDKISDAINEYLNSNNDLKYIIVIDDTKYELTKEDVDFIKGNNSNNNNADSTNSESTEFINQHQNEGYKAIDQNTVYRKTENGTVEFTNITTNENNQITNTATKTAGDKNISKENQYEYDSNGSIKSKALSEYDTETGKISKRTTVYNETNESNGEHECFTQFNSNYFCAIEYEIHKWLDGTTLTRKYSKNPDTYFCDVQTDPSGTIAFMTHSIRIEGGVSEDINYNFFDFKFAIHKFTYDENGSRQYQPAEEADITQETIEKLYNERMITKDQHDYLSAKIQSSQKEGNDADVNNNAGDNKVDGGTNGAGGDADKLEKIKEDLKKQEIITADGKIDITNLLSQNKISDDVMNYLSSLDPNGSYVIIINSFEFEFTNINLEFILNTTSENDNTDKSNWDSSKFIKQHQNEGYVVINQNTVYQITENNTVVLFNIDDKGNIEKIGESSESKAVEGSGNTINTQDVNQNDNNAPKPDKKSPEEIENSLKEYIDSNGNFNMANFSQLTPEQRGFLREGFKGQFIIVKNNTEFILTDKDVEFITANDSDNNTADSANWESTNFAEQNRSEGYTVIDQNTVYRIIENNTVELTNIFTNENNKITNTITKPAGEKYLSKENQYEILSEYDTETGYISEKIRRNFDSNGEVESDCFTKFNRDYFCAIEFEIFKNHNTGAGYKRVYFENPQHRFYDILTNSNNTITKIIDYIRVDGGVSKDICYDFNNLKVKTSPFTYENGNQQFKSTEEADITKETIENLYNDGLINEDQRDALLDKIQDSQDKANNADVNNNAGGADGADNNAESGQAQGTGDNSNAGVDDNAGADGSSTGDESNNGNNAGNGTTEGTGDGSNTGDSNANNNAGNGTTEGTGDGSNTGDSNANNNAGNGTTEGNGDSLNKDGTNADNNAESGQAQGTGDNSNAGVDDNAGADGTSTGDESNNGNNAESNIDGIDAVPDDVYNNTESGAAEDIEDGAGVEDVAPEGIITDPDTNESGTSGIEEAEENISDPSMAEGNITNGDNSNDGISRDEQKAKIKESLEDKNVIVNGKVDDDMLQELIKAGEITDDERQYLKDNPDGLDKLQKDNQNNNQRPEEIEKDLKDNGFIDSNGNFNMANFSQLTPEQKGFLREGFSGQFIIVINNIEFKLSPEDMDFITSNDSNNNTADSANWESTNFVDQHPNDGYYVINQNTVYQITENNTIVLVNIDGDGNVVNTHTLTNSENNVEPSAEPGNTPSATEQQPEIENNGQNQIPEDRPFPETTEQWQQFLADNGIVDANGDVNLNVLLHVNDKDMMMGINKFLASGEYTGNFKFTTSNGQIITMPRELITFLNQSIKNAIGVEDYGNWPSKQFETNHPGCIAFTQNIVIQIVNNTKINVILVKNNFPQSIGTYTVDIEQLGGSLNTADSENDAVSETEQSNGQPDDENLNIGGDDEYFENDTSEDNQQDSQLDSGVSDPSDTGEPFDNGTKAETNPDNLSDDDFQNTLGDEDAFDDGSLSEEYQQDGQPEGEMLDTDDAEQFDEDDGEPETASHDSDEDVPCQPLENPYVMKSNISLSDVIGLRSYRLRNK